MPSVSVIMTVYNTDDQVLRRAITSILGQSLKDIELIVVDDASVNNAFDVISCIAEHDDRLRVIRNTTNMKAAHSRNQCILASRANYVAIMDADDECSPERLQVQKEFLDSRPQFDFVGTAAWLFDEQGVWGQRTCPTQPLKSDFLFVLPFVHASLMFRKQALMAVGNYRVTKVTRRMEDYELLMRMYASGSRGANLQRPLYSMREDEAALRRRKYAYRLDEVRVRYSGFIQLGLMPRGMPYVLKPLVVGLIPSRMLSWMKDIYYSRRHVSGL